MQRLLELLHDRVRQLLGLAVLRSCEASRSGATGAGPSPPVLPRELELRLERFQLQLLLAFPRVDALNVFSSENRRSTCR